MFMGQQRLTPTGTTVPVGTTVPFTLLIVQPPIHLPRLGRGYKLMRNPATRADCCIPSIDVDVRVDLDSSDTESIGLQDGPDGGTRDTYNARDGQGTGQVSCSGRP